MHHTTVEDGWISQNVIITFFYVDPHMPPCIISTHAKMKSIILHNLINMISVNSYINMVMSMLELFQLMMDTFIHQWIQAQVTCCSFLD